VPLTVHRQLGGQYYLAQLAGQASRIVASNVNLTAGAPQRAVVVAVGPRLQLKLLDSGHEPGNLVTALDSDQGPDEDSADSPDAGVAAQIHALSARYQVPLSNLEHDRLAQAMKSVAEPRSMALSGFYLAKLGLDLSPDALGALYAAVQNGSPPAPAAVLDVSALLPNLAPQAQAQLHSLVERMDATLNTASGEQHGDTDSERHGALARELLNGPLGEGLARHYGTIPVLVSGQLLELQLVAFQHRETPSERSPVRRLFMTLTTPALGRVQIAAQAQGQRLSVTFTGASVRATDALASHAAEVRELATRLGWHVDSVVYSVGQPTGGAEIAMTHVLLDSTMDQLL
jgi:hypothetical protein